MLEDLLSLPGWEGDLDEAYLELDGNHFLSVFEEDSQLVVHVVEVQECYRYSEPLFFRALKPLLDWEERLVLEEITYYY